MLQMKLVSLLWDLVKLLLKMILYYPVQSGDGQQDKEDGDRQLEYEAAATTSDLTWYDLQVPVVVPVVIDTESIKKQLPVVQYRDLMPRKTNRQRQLQAISSSSKSEEEILHVSSCIVCMNVIEGSDEVRELCNCEHVFHRDCLDAWIGQAQLTCPLCRSELLIPATTCGTISKHDKDGGGDPWRAERMIYLFVLLCNLLKFLLKKIIYYPELFFIHSVDDEQNKDDSDHQLEVMNFEAAATSHSSWLRFQVPVVVPVVVDADSIEKQLPVVKYWDLNLKKRSRQHHLRATSSSSEEEMLVHHVLCA
ncbi:hypothetical protein ACLB2K_075346 [Fragaria x ananassa]